MIPREGGHLVRLYVDMGEAPAEEPGLRESLTADDVIRTAQQVLHPYTLDIKELPWWSVYQVGQRLADRFDDVTDDERGHRVPRVFIAGDACHTHSAKAGQGMNVSMQDAFNLGWKLGAVLRGRSPQSLLDTYTAERHPVAHELIEFDKTFSKIIGGRPRGAHTTEGVGPGEVQDAFTAAGRFTAGVATHYPASTVVGDDRHQELAKGLTVGMRFHSAPVVRLADAKPMQLGHVHQADGRWRLYLFADHTPSTDPGSGLNQFCDFLQSSENSPLVQFTAHGGDVDSVFDVRAVLQDPGDEITIEDVHPILLPKVGRLGLKDYEKVFVPATGVGENIFDLRGIDRGRGAVVVVRPDQYVALVLPLCAREELTDFFGEFMTPVA